MSVGRQCHFVVLHGGSDMSWPAGLLPDATGASNVSQLGDPEGSARAVLWFREIVVQGIQGKPPMGKLVFGVLVLFC